MWKPGSSWRGHWPDGARIVGIVAVVGGVVVGQGAAAAGPARAVKRPAPASAPAVDLTAVRAALIGRDLDAAVRAAAALGELALPAAHDALLDALATGLAPR